MEHFFSFLLVFSSSVEWKKKSNEDTRLLQRVRIDSWCNSASFALPIFCLTVSPQLYYGGTTITSKTEQYQKVVQEKYFYRQGIKRLNVTQCSGRVQLWLLLTPVCDRPEARLDMIYFTYAPKDIRVGTTFSVSQSGWVLPHFKKGLGEIKGGVKTIKNNNIVLQNN